MRKLIPAPVIAACSEIMAERESHASMNNLFMYAGAPGDPPEGSKPVKAQEWLRRINADVQTDPLQVLGRLIEGYMEEAPPEARPFDDKPVPLETADQQKISKALSRYDFQYIKGGTVTGTVGAPSKTLDEFIRKHDLPAVEHEFSRALSNVDANPREAVSAASNILESICKVYIEERHLEKPPKQDLKPIWTVVRKDLGFDPSLVEDQDLQVILTGLFAVVEGIGSLRTHASSAHGAGKKQYRLEPRHARLAIHASHTAALFILESWKRVRAI
ncbi:abortive infection family protein [Janthinobacterium sp. P210006]|uniref:abortive infection family protein n=1 Tax=Janthinobacterium sp. P210006 TaxID=3112939 RepID=UPI002E273AFE|nr:abortive infection family protein [Janthinobacterium sp. P210006]